MLGSHDVQNVTLSSCGPGEIRVAGDFIRGSLAIGVLVIIYSPNNDSNIHYRFISRQSDTTPLSTVSGLPGGRYKASVFVVQDRGLPFNRSATAPRNVSVCEGT